MNKQTILTTVGIIAILALITLGIYYSQNITPKQNSLLPVANQTNNTPQNEQGLQDQIDDLISQLNQLNDGNDRWTYNDAEIGISIDLPNNLVQNPDAPRTYASAICGRQDPVTYTHAAFRNKSNISEGHYTVGISLWDTNFNQDNIGDIYTCDPNIDGTYVVDGRTAYRIHNGDAGMAAYMFNMPGKNNQHLVISFGGVTPIDTMWTETLIRQVLDTVEIN